MAGFLIILVFLLLFLIYLSAESIIYNKTLNQVPLRISVSGTRGKSAIVRTLASVLRSHGIRVIAKTTGSEAMYILPDGSSEKVGRRGLISVIEQKQLINKAVKLNVQCVIAEIMSIHPDNHAIETNKLIKPHLTILSNFRADHTDVAGESIGEIADLFARDIFHGSKVIVPEAEINEFILNRIGKAKASLITAGEDICNELNLPPSVGQKQFSSNLDAVMATARYLGIPDETTREGILETHPDIGQHEIFRLLVENRKVWLVNAFAANDPVSTKKIIEKTILILSPEMFGPTETIALLSLRSDRGERSRQWLNFLQSESNSLFNRVFVSGIHASIFTRKLKNCENITSRDPERITRQIIESTTGDILVFGIVNIHGLGIELLKYWKATCKPT